MAFTFLKEDYKLIKEIIKKKTLAISNSENNHTILLIDIEKNEPLEWMKNEENA
jgi:hypothetical protein